MKFPIIDLHQDLQAHLNDLSLFPRGKQTDFDWLKQEQFKIVTATAFPLPPEDRYFDPITNDLIESDFQTYLAHTRKDPDWTIIRSAADLNEMLNTPNKHGLILHIEGLNVISDTLEDWTRLTRWYDLGWRSLGIVWNLTNPLGGGTLDAETGLTAFGKKMLEWLQEKRMIVDFAHMNARTFWQALDITRGPVLVSHGNCTARCPSSRNYTDEQLRAIANHGGIVGAFFANTYVVGRGNPGTVSDVANHIDHLIQVMGAEHVALGTDFGGIVTGLIQGLESIDKLPNLWDELLRRGYAEDVLERIAWKNAARVISATLPYDRSL